MSAVVVGAAGGGGGGGAVDCGGRRRNPRRLERVGGDTLDRSSFEVEEGVLTESEALRRHAGMSVRELL